MTIVNAASQIQQRPTRDLIHSLGFEGPLVLGVGNIRIYEKLPTCAFGRFGKRKQNRVVPAVHDHKHGGVGAALHDTRGLRPSIHQHAEAFHQAVFPLVAAEFRTVGVDPRDGFDAGLFVGFGCEKATMPEYRIAMT